MLFLFRDCFAFLSNFPLRVKDAFVYLKSGRRRIQFVHLLVPAEEIQLAGVLLVQLVEAVHGAAR